MLANWFIGIVAPAGPWCERVPPPPAGIRAFDPADMHFTIAFLGGVTEAAADKAWAALSFSLPPIDVTLGAVVPMGPPARFSALSALLVDGRERVENAIGAARGACWDAAGTAPDARPAKAHLTLARPQRRATNEERGAALAWSSSIDLGAAPLRLDTVALYTWAADRQTRLFRIARTAPFAPP